MGLPDIASAAEIEKNFQQRDEDDRRRSAQSLGLPANAGWDVIAVAKEERSRQEAIQKYGLPPDATRGDINKFLDEQQKKPPESPNQ